MKSFTEMKYTGTSDDGVSLSDFLRHRDWELKSYQTDKPGVSLREIMTNPDRVTHPAFDDLVDQVENERAEDPEVAAWRNQEWD